MLRVARRRYATGRAAPVLRQAGQLGPTTGETGNFSGVGYEFFAVARPLARSLPEEVAVASTAAVEWKITVEGTDTFGEVRRQEILIDKSWDRLFDGELGLSVEDGKKIMAALVHNLSRPCENSA